MVAYPRGEYKILITSGCRWAVSPCSRSRRIVSYLPEGYSAWHSLVLLTHIAWERGHGLFLSGTFVWLSEDLLVLPDRIELSAHSKKGRQIRRQRRDPTVSLRKICGCQWWG